MKQIPEGTKETLVIEVTKKTVRVKKNNKVARYFSRNYGHDEFVLSYFKEKGFKKGKTEISLKDFISLLESLPTRAERSIEKVKEKKVGEEVEVLDTSNRARRKYKKALKENGLEHIIVLKKGQNKVEIKEKEIKEESLDFDEFF